MHHRGEFAMGCKYRYSKTIEYWDGSSPKMDTTKLQEFLKENLMFWKWAVENPSISGFDINRDKDWREENIKKIKDLVSQIITEENIDNIRSLLEKLFATKKEESLIWASWGGLLNFIKGAGNKEIYFLKDLLKEIYSAEKFDDSWSNKLRDQMIAFNSNFKNLKNLEGTIKNVLGELFGKLHIDKHPICNGNSKAFLSIFFIYDSSSYEDCEKCFEIVKKEYENIVGRVMSSTVPINFEIDSMFNFYFHKADLKDEEKWKELKKKWYSNSKKKSTSGCYLEIIKVPRKRANIDIYKDTHIGKYLWCPNTKEYANGEKGVMEKVKSGDIIIHDWDGIIYGYSIVEKEPESISKENLIKIFENEGFLSDSYKDAIEKYTSKNIKGFYIVKLKNYSRLEKEFRYSDVEGLPEQQNLQRLRGKYLLELDKDVCKYLGVMQDWSLEEIPFEKDIETLLNAKNQIILYGPPGTGKTWIARMYALKRAGENSDHVAFVTFHPSFSYEDFVESIKPNTDEDELKFRIEEGIFKRIARNAYNALLEYAGVHISKRWDVNGELPDLENDERNKVKDALDKENFPKFYIIIDEINRGDISKIFGELITLLEKDKRLFMENEMIVRLPYSKKRFGVPPNLYIIGTMNTADRSIALMDVALRRRFAFLEIMPSYRVLLKYLGISTVNKEDDAVEEIKRWKGDDLRDIKKLAIKALYTINEGIKKNYDRDHQIGHSYYLQLKDAATQDELENKLKYVWLYEILPLLQEYFYGSNESLEKILYPCNKSENVENDVIECYKRDIMKEDESWDIANFFNAIINHKKSSEKNE